MRPGEAGSAALADVEEPRLDAVPGGRGVTVRVLEVGLDGTDGEIAAGAYGRAPEGSEQLVLGHEGFGVVAEVGPEVRELAPGDLVVARVRRAQGSSLYDLLDRPDLTTDPVTYEHGIAGLHGFLTERYVEEPRYLVRVPATLAPVGVLVEPTSIVAKALTVVEDVQRRLGVWRPRRAAVLGVGPIGLLGALALRLEGLEVTAFGLHPPPYLNATLVEDLGGRYVSTRQRSLSEEAGAEGPYDVVLEATGYSPLAFEAMGVLARNGILVLSSVTAGSRTAEVPADDLNMRLVLANNVVVGTVNASRMHFERALAILAHAEVWHPGWTRRLLTHRVEGLERFTEALDLLGTDGAVKVTVGVGTR